MKARRARPGDVPAIHALIASYAAQGLLLPRTREEIAAHISHFLVVEDAERVAGCVALEPYGAELAEIRSLAVAPGERGRGLGARLLRHAVAVARRRGFARVFAVTHAPEFFTRQGFAPQPRQSLVEKLERDCMACPKRRTCRLVAVVALLRPLRATLPVVAAQSVSVP
jgi:amino-acid N-acetyltransferase